MRNVDDYVQSLQEIKPPVVVCNPVSMLVIFIQMVMIVQE